MLRQAADKVPGARLGALRIGPVDGAPTEEPGVPPPPSALWPGPLRIGAEFAATRLEPFPALADRLRATLSETATHRLGLHVTEVDLRITGVDQPGEASEAETSAAPAAPAAPGTSPARSRPPHEDTPEARAATAALAVPGVTRLGGAFGGRTGAVRVDHPAPGRPGHVRLELAVSPGHRPLEVARAVRRAVTEALPDRPSVAVLVTEVG
ncbi:nucleopolyhedrovirus P10 family protein [Streptomyces albidoflavus]|uniref:nucleopolyhedrovirus P10 family protein n=1 Tax=Streptomyces albidoflavus TaxID=1886 RepID=UPI003334461C